MYAPDAVAVLTTLHSQLVRVGVAVPPGLLFEECLVAILRLQATFRGGIQT